MKFLITYEVTRHESYEIDATNEADAQHKVDEGMRTYDDGVNQPGDYIGGDLISIKLDDLRLADYYHDDCDEDDQELHGCGQDAKFDDPGQDRAPRLT